jgi:hypothetical protein
LNLIGLNLHATINQEWDTSVQLEARGDSNNDFGTFLNFGFASWHPNSNFSIRAGRMPNLFWLYSQQIDIGLSYAWTNLPTEVYTLASGFKSVDGLSFLYSSEIGPGILQSELIFGGGTQTLRPSNSFSQVQTTAVVEIKNGISLDLKYELDHKLTTRIGYSQGEVAVQSTTNFLTTANSPTFPGGVAPVMASIVTNHDTHRGQFFSAGTKYDSDTFFGGGEIVRRLINGSYAPQATAYYVMGGYHFGKWSPYYTYSASTALEGSSQVHPNVALTTSLMKNAHSNILGLNFNVNDSVLVKTSFTRSHQEYNITSSNLNWNTYQASVNFVF